MDKAHQRETSASLPETELKVIDVDDRINSFDSLSEDSDYMWPSSDSLSSSLLSSDDSQDVLDCECYRLSIQGQISSLSLSTVSSVISFEDYSEYSFRDVSKTSPRSEMSSGQMFFAGKVLGELQSGVDGNRVKNSVVHSERSNQCHIEDPSISKILFALPSENMDTPSWDLERTDIWVSSLDLEREDTELIRTSEKDSGIFDSDFPSPSFCAFSAMTPHQIWSSSSRSLTSDGKEDKNNRATTGSDEPLVWPFDHSLYSRLDFEKFLRPSPCKDETNISTAGLPGPKLTRLQFHHNCPPAQRKNIQGLGRRNMFSLTPKSVITRSEMKDVGNGAQKATLVQSRLSRSTKALIQYPSTTSKRRGKPQLKIDVQRHACNSNELNRQMKELKLHHSFLVRNSIENIIGLNEFDGHEGISVDLEEEFAFYLSPCKGLMPTKSLESTKGQWLPTYHEDAANGFIDVTVTNSSGSFGKESKEEHRWNQ